MASYPLSHIQKGIWSLYQIEPKSRLYNICKISEISGKLDTVALSKSLQLLINRHDSLKVNFKEVDGEPVQIVNRRTKAYLKVIDLSKEKENKKRKKKNRIIDREVNKPFNLEKNPLFRTILIRLSKNRHTLLVVTHHIIFDGWSTDIIFKELGLLYDAYLKGQANPLLPVTAQYKDYVAWEQKRIRSGELKKQESYWIKKLGGDVPVLNLPLAKPRPPIGTYSGNTQEKEISGRLVKNIYRFCQKSNVTLFSFFFVIFNIFLQRITGQDDLIVGTLVSSRFRYEFENAVGIFLNGVAVRSDLSGNLSFVKLLYKIRRNITEAIDNSEYPLDLLVEKLDIRKDLSRPSIFSVLFRVDNKDAHKMNLTGTKTDARYISAEISRHDLRICLREKNDERFVLNCEYNTDIFNEETIRIFLNMMATLAESVVKNPKSKIADLEVVSKEDKYRLDKFNKTESPYPKNKSISDIFERQVRKNPNKIAAEFKGNKITYQELNRKSNQLARSLQKNGLSFGQTAILLMERSINALVSILAIAKAGGIYAPIDVDFPLERIKYMIKDARPSLIITTRCLKNRLKGIRRKTFILNEEREKIRKEKTGNLNLKIDQKEPFCVIYTSGSTGTPKGVIMSQRQVISHAFYQIPGFSSKDTLAHNKSLSNTGSIWQFFCPLFFGARSLIYPSEVISNPTEFFERAVEDRVTVVWTSPSLLSSCLNDLPRGKNKTLGQLRLIMVGGERILVSLANSFREKYKTPLFNTYGQTEYTDIALVHQITSKENLTFAPLGSPFFNTKVYILDKNLKLLPVGIPGEICVSGDGAAIGYLGNYSKGRHKFVNNPFIKKWKMIRTGDRGRFLADGTIEFIGRIDDQIDLRGNRIEPAEIEAVLRKYPGVSGCIVKKINVKNEDYLVAYYSSKKLFDNLELKAFVRKKLPEFMTPNYFIHLDELSLNTGSKTNRIFLPALEAAVRKKENYSLPETETEKKLASIWKKVLGVKKIGKYDNFSDLGGHSLKALLLFSLLKKAGYSLSLKDIFLHPTLKDMSVLIGGKSERGKTNGYRITKERVLGGVPFTYIEDWLARNKLSDGTKSVVINCRNIDKIIFKKTVGDLNELFKSRPTSVSCRSIANSCFSHKITISCREKINKSELKKYLRNFQYIYNLNLAGIEPVKLKTENNIYTPQYSYPEHYCCLHASFIELVRYKLGKHYLKSFLPALDFACLPNYFVVNKNIKYVKSENASYLNSKDPFTGAGVKLKLVRLKRKEEAEEYYRENIKNREPALLIGPTHYLSFSRSYQDREFIESALRRGGMYLLNASLFSKDSKSYPLVYSTNLKYFGRVPINEFWNYWTGLKIKRKRQKGENKFLDSFFSYQAIEVEGIDKISMPTGKKLLGVLKMNVDEYFRGKIINSGRQEGLRIYYGQSALRKYRKDILDNMLNKQTSSPDILLLDLTRQFARFGDFLKDLLEEISLTERQFSKEQEMANLISFKWLEIYSRLWQEVKEKGVDYEYRIYLFPDMSRYKEKVLSGENKRYLLKEVEKIILNYDSLFKLLGEKLKKYNF